MVSSIWMRPYADTGANMCRVCTPVSWTSTRLTRTGELKSCCSVPWRCSYATAATRRRNSADSKRGMIRRICVERCSKWANLRIPAGEGQFYFSNSFAGLRGNLKPWLLMGGSTELFVQTFQYHIENSENFVSCFI